MQGKCYAIFVSLVIDLIGFTVILPLLPSIFDHYSKNDESGLYFWLNDKVVKLQGWMDSPSEYNKVLLAGLIGSWFSLLQFLSQPIIGSLSDIFGRKPLLLLNLFGVGCSYFLWFLSRRSFCLFIISRSICGVSKGNISVSTATMSDATTEKERGKAMALVGVAFSIGFIVGPLLGALFSLRSGLMSGDFFAYPALFALTLSGVNLIFIWLFFEESLPIERRAKSIGKGLSTCLNYLNPLALFSFNPVQKINQNELVVLRESGGIYFLYLFLYSGLEYTLTFLTHIRFEYTSMQQGKLYLVSGLIMTFIQGAIVRRIKAGNETRVILMGLAVIIPSFVIIGFSANESTLYTGLVLYSVASATVVPCMTTIVSSHGPADQKGTVIGVFRCIGALARAVGPLFASLIYWRFGATFCYVCGGLLMSYPLLRMTRLSKRISSLKAKAT